MAAVLGIEIGNDSIKIAVCNAGKVKKLISERLPENMVREGKIAIPEAMTAYLKELRKKYKLGATKVKLVLPDEIVFTKTFSMPVMSDAELRLNLPYEFRDYVGDEKTSKIDYIYDYSVLSVTEGDDVTPGEMNLFAAAVSEPHIEEYKNIFKKAGLKLVCGVPREMALQNIVRNAANAPEELVIVDVGHVKTSVDIYCNGVYSMGKTVELGGQALDSIIAADDKVDDHTAVIHKETNLDGCQSNPGCIEVYNQIAGETIKIVNFYSYSTHSENLRDIYFCGGSSLIETLRVKLIKGTELNPHNVGKLLSDTEEGMENSLICALAAGAGIQPDKEPKPAAPAKKKEEKAEEGTVNG